MMMFEQANFLENNIFNYVLIFFVILQEIYDLARFSKLTNNINIDKKL